MAIPAQMEGGLKNNRMACAAVALLGGCFSPMSIRARVPPLRMGIDPEVQDGLCVHEQHKLVDKAGYAV